MMMTGVAAAEMAAGTGDPEGHSEASRRGWEEREGSRSRSRYDDDDDRRGNRGHGGWYGDPEGHSQAARRGRR
jgi:hypothetical protein